MALSNYLDLKMKLETIMGELTCSFQYSDDYRNLIDGDEKNWLLYDKFAKSVTELDLNYVPESDQDDLMLRVQDTEKYAKLYQYFIQWMFADLRLLRYFPPQYFRQAEMVHGLVTLHGERVKIMTMIYFLFGKVNPIEEFEPFQILANEVYFLDEKNQVQPPDLMLVYLIQQIMLEGKIIQMLFDMSEQNDDLDEQKKKLKTHYQAQLDYLTDSLLKTWELKPSLKESFVEESVPALNYMQKFLLFSSLMGACHSLDKSFIVDFHNDFQDYCVKYGILSKTSKLEPLGKVLKMSKGEKVYYTDVTSVVTNKFIQDVKEVVDSNASENDEIIKKSTSELFSAMKFKDIFDTSIYQYYMYEQEKIQWHTHDVVKYMDKYKSKLEITDNDYELLDIIKEIGYCEAYAYTIGYNNMIHMGRDHSFVLWNVLQCHEELKHFHAIRVMLQASGTQTKYLDEDFVARMFNPPKAEYFKSQYDMFFINFLGETHNIRAYLLLAECFQNSHFIEVMKWITDDEVVHKKVFAAHFQAMCKRDPNWEKDSYECMIEQSLGVHQAQTCVHYHTMMKKIGKFYVKKGGITALEFLNKSLRAQYLELKSLYSPEIFTMSEMDFRQRQVKAYAF
ncbi:MAG: ferritin-like domain-containing protein [Candidatus Cloacimonetes bacterium]|nr:ferritin-like domain-containing protein [Candidatus Cloacimonadota bacterium]